MHHAQNLGHETLEGKKHENMEYVSDPFTRVPVNDDRGGLGIFQPPIAIFG